MYGGDTVKLTSSPLPNVCLTLWPCRRNKSTELPFVGRVLFGLHYVNVVFHSSKQKLITHYLSEIVGSYPPKKWNMSACIYSIFQSILVKCEDLKVGLFIIVAIKNNGIALYIIIVQALMFLLLETLLLMLDTYKF